MSEKAPMQSTPFVSSTGETRNPIYEGQFDGETPEQAEARRHWAKVAMEMARNAALSAPSHGEQVREHREARVISFRPGMGEVTFYVAGGVPDFMDPGCTIHVYASAPSAGSQEQE